MRYTGCRFWLSSPGALSGLATRVLVSLTPLRRSAFWPRLVGFLRCSSHLCWCVRFFPTAGFLGWDAESSTLRFGLGCGLGSSALPPVSEASISSSATVGNHKYLLSKFFAIFHFILMFHGECHQLLRPRDCHHLTQLRARKESAAQTRLMPAIQGAECRPDECRRMSGCHMCAEY